MSWDWYVHCKSCAKAISMGNHPTRVSEGLKLDGTTNLPCPHQGCVTVHDYGQSDFFDAEKFLPK